MKGPCICCGPKVCRPCWVYVVADKDGSGPVKVGISFHPVQRLSQHRKKTQRDLCIHFKRAFTCEFRAMEAEENAIDALSAARVYGDWFGVAVAEAIKAVKAAKVSI